MWILLWRLIVEIYILMCVCVRCLLCTSQQLLLLERATHKSAHCLLYIPPWKGAKWLINHTETTFYDRLRLRFLVQSAGRLQPRLQPSLQWWCACAKLHIHLCIKHGWLILSTIKRFFLKVTPCIRAFIWLVWLFNCLHWQWEGPPVQQVCPLSFYAERLPNSSSARVSITHPYSIWYWNLWTQCVWYI